MPEYQIDIQKMIRDLETENLAGYGSWPLPCHVDDKISTIIGIFLRPTPNERKVSFGKTKTSLLFLSFSRRMAILGVRENSENRLFEGLMAHVIEDFRYDYRENLIMLSLLHYSAYKIGLNPYGLFQRAAAFATPETADHLLGYGRRKPGVGLIESMGYREVVTPDGISYERSE
jgi:hypothetical protein